MKINLQALHSKQAFICDMDGVIYHGNRLLPAGGGSMMLDKTVRDVLDHI